MIMTIDSIICIIIIITITIVVTIIIIIIIIRVPRVCSGTVRQFGSSVCLRRLRSALVYFVSCYIC